MDILVDDAEKEEEEHNRRGAASDPAAALDAISSCLEQLECRIRGTVLELLRQIDIKQASAYRGGGGGGGFAPPGGPGSVNRRRSIFSDRGEALR